LTKTKSETAGQLLYYFLHDTGLLSKLLAPDNPEAEKKAQNISRFFDKLKSYEVEHDDAKVHQVVDWLDLSMELGESPLSIDSDWSKINAVNILTVHGSKGLEFPVVFLVNLVSQRFPTIERREQIPIPDALIKEVLPQGDYHIQEERRLFYVGITRAQERLYITAADYYGEGKREKKLSPFIFEALGDAALASEQKHIETGTQLSFLDYAPHEGAHSIREERIPFHVDYLSYSQIETFQTCPLHYKLRYILNIPTPPSAALSFGSSMHAALQRFYTKLRAGEKASEELLCACLDEVWIKEGYSGKDHERQTMEAGYKYLKGFLTGDCYIDGKHPIALEQNFLLPLPSSRSDSSSFPRKRESTTKSQAPLIQIEYERPLKIGGKIDRVDELSDGRIEIIDYKTGRVPDQKEVDKNMQMTFYALAGAFMKEAPYPKKCEEITLSLYYFEEQKKMSTVRTMDQLHNAIDEIYSVRKEIEESDFKCQNHMFCESCEFSLFCKMDGGK
jgi:DNA helicase-2/ATP-dependent DNA helicase PcrA